MTSPHGWSGYTDRDHLSKSELVLVNGVAVLAPTSKQPGTHDSRKRGIGRQPEQEDLQLLDQVLSTNQEIEDLLLEGATRRANETAREL